LRHALALNWLKEGDLVQEVEGQAIFDKFLSDFTRANPEIMAAHFAPDAVFWGTHSRDLIKGRDEIRQYFADAFRRLPGAKATAIGKVAVVKASDNVFVVSGIWQNEVSLRSGPPSLMSCYSDKCPLV
jgi:hypothetical protein